MIIFWIVCALLLLLALSFVFIPLWRGSVRGNSVQRDHANLEIFRDQIAEMEADLRNGLLTQELYEQGKQELQGRLLDEVAETPVAASSGVAKRYKLLLFVVVIMVPALAIALYSKVGNYHALSQTASRAESSLAEQPLTESALKELEDKVAAQPGDAESLWQLAHAYAELERYTDAVQLYDKLTQIVPKEAQLWVDYADALAMASNKSLLGTPTKLLDKALALDPDNFKALALAGSAAMERHDFAPAVMYWEKLQKMIPPEDPNAKIVEAGIQHARAMLAQNGNTSSAPMSQAAGSGERTQAAAGGKEAISGTVVLSNMLAAQANPNDTLFVLVRAAEGPKMPLAIVRKQVKDLPFKFTLDDSTSMSPQMKVSNFEQVVVIARVSKSGNAMTQTGDLQGMSAVIKPGSKGIKLIIDKVAP